MNRAAYSRKKEWVMNPEAMDRLLSILDPDLGTAVRRLDRIKNKLTNMFRWRGFSEPERYAANAIEGAARALFEGAELPAYNPDIYFHRVAIIESNLAKEHPRETDASRTERFGLPDGEFVNPDGERLLQCLKAALNALPQESLELIKRYHQPGEPLRKEARRELSRSLGISQAALRTRAFRIRSELQISVTNCLRRMK